MKIKSKGGEKVKFFEACWGALCWLWNDFIIATYKEIKSWFIKE